MNNNDIRKNLPLVIAPYSSRHASGIGTWTKNMIDYSESQRPDTFYNTLTYANQLKRLTNTQLFPRIFTGLILYSKLFFKVLISIRNYKPTVLHITSSASIGLLKDQALIWLSKLKKIPVIMHWHFGRIPTLAKQQNWEWKILCNIIRKSHTCIVIDESSYNSLLNEGFKNILNIPNPIGLFVEQESRKLLCIPTQKIQGRIIYVGHVERLKGVIELVKECSQLTLVKELLLIGPYETAIKEELIKLACLRGNGKWLRLTGKLSKEQVLEYMFNSPILALPSYTEGFPNVVLEAMALGCAVIATDVGAIPQMLDITSQSPCGICVPVRDGEKLREAIIALIKDPLRTETLGNNGIERVLDNYTLEKVIQHYKSVWEMAAGR